MVNSAAAAYQDAHRPTCIHKPVFLITYAHVFIDGDINSSFISPGEFPHLHQSYMHHHLQTAG